MQREPRPDQESGSDTDESRADDVAVVEEPDETGDLSASLTALFQVAASQGRDWKLIDALLRTMIEFVVETQGDVFTRTDKIGAAAASELDAAESQSSGRTTAYPGRRLRPEFRDRIEAVIDSWSDDETADYLQIGLRQVRRRAQQGSLYYFCLGRKRRYPVWQFDRYFGVLPGLGDVVRAIPRSWRPEQVYGFMTGRQPDLGSMTPAQWLLGKNDAARIASVAQKTLDTKADQACDRSEPRNREENDGSETADV